MYRLPRSLLVALLVALFASTWTTVAAADEGLQLQVTELDATDFPNVRVRLSVLDTSGRPVEGLTASDLVVTEEGRRQQVDVVALGEQQPLAIALVLDTSGTMSGKPLADAKAAMTTLVRSLGPADRAAIVTFSTTVTVAQGLTNDKAALAAAIDGATAGGNTAIFDASNAALDLLAPIGSAPRRAVIMLTDGQNITSGRDNASAATLDDARIRIGAAGFPLYIVGLGDVDRPILQTLVGSTAGGALYLAPTSEELAAIYRSLSRRISVQYGITYRSDASTALDNATLGLALQVVRGGVLGGSVSTTVTVPPGRGAVIVSSGETVVIAAPAATVASAVATPAPTADAPAISLRLAIADATASSDPAILAGLLASATVLFGILAVGGFLGSRSLSGLDRRLLAAHVGGPRRDPAAAPRRSLWSRVGLPTLARVALPFGRLAFSGLAEGTRTRLLQAGEPFGLGPAEFLALRMTAAAIAASAGALVAMLADPRPLFAVLVAVGAALFGFVVPGILLDRAAKARGRLIRRALPDALDMLALSASAGMTLDGAIAQVTQRWHGPLSDELRRLLLEFNLGRGRRVALRALAVRTGIPEVSRFVNALVQADTLGVPISRVLMDQAAELRTSRRQQAEEAARKAPVKMLFPLIGLIFPALFVVILGPAVPRLMAMFQGVN